MTHLWSLKFVMLFTTVTVSPGNDVTSSVGQGRILNFGENVVTMHFITSLYLIPLTMITEIFYGSGNTGAHSRLVFLMGGYPGLFSVWILC